MPRIRPRFCILSYVHITCIQDELYNSAGDRSKSNTVKRVPAIGAGTLRGYT